MLLPSPTSVWNREGALSLCWLPRSVVSREHDGGREIEEIVPGLPDDGVDLDVSFHRPVDGAFVGNGE